MTVDQRLIERRRAVAEDQARRGVRRLVRFLIVLAVLGGGVWLSLSPLLSVKEVLTVGVVSSATHGSLAEHEVLAGTPMILLRPGEIEAMLEEDPWVSDAAVRLEWPHQVLVRIEERVPAAWVETAGGWGRRAVDGVALPSPGQPDDSLPLIRLGSVALEDAETSRLVLGALQFVDALPAELKVGATVRVEANGELWAEVSGYQVRLGRAIEMPAKALSLSALLLEQPPIGSTLTLIAPTHPAVSVPMDGDTAGEETETGSNEDQP